MPKFRYSITNLLLLYHTFLFSRKQCHFLWFFLTGQHKKLFLELICGKKSQVSSSGLFIAVNGKYQIQQLKQDLTLFNSSAKGLQKVMLLLIIFYRYQLARSASLHQERLQCPTPSRASFLSLPRVYIIYMKGKQFWQILLKFAIKLVATTLFK